MLFGVKHLNTIRKTRSFSKVLEELGQKKGDLKGPFHEILVGKGAKG